MRRRWQIILPTVGLIFFLLQSYASIQQNQQIKNPGSSYVWGAIKLDRDPLKIDPVYRSPDDESPCSDKEENCAVGWDPVRLWVDPGPLASLIVLSGLPAFFLSGIIWRQLSVFGISQLLSFMVATPILLSIWYWFLGWLFDRRRWQKKVRH